MKLEITIYQGQLVNIVTRGWIDPLKNMIVKIFTVENQNSASP
jgi:hypothetical protein